LQTDKAFWCLVGVTPHRPKGVAYSRPTVTWVRNTEADDPTTVEPERVSAAELRRSFAADDADHLAEQVGASVDARLPGGRGRSDRYVWFGNDEALTLVVGAHEAHDVDTALAIGLAERRERKLRLVLPRSWHEPTLHRWPWLRDDLPLEVWTHADGSATALDRPTQDETSQLARSSEEPALFLGEQKTAWVEPLMRWAGDHPDLDPSHRRGVRAWQCRGQRVLRIEPSTAGVTIVAGIDWGTNSPHETPEPLPQITGPLGPEELSEVQKRVQQGCEERLRGIARKPDEHWLQAVLRRNPQCLGLEQPVLRELPAWRPRGSAGTRQKQPRGRGYVDLVGLDATGVLVLVETKLGGDDMMILQGLDYLIWAETNRDRLTARLDCRSTVPFEIAYCVGGQNGGTPTWSRHAAAQLSALAPDLRWHVQEVTGWFEDQPVNRRHALRTFPQHAPSVASTGKAT
jgi:hypothetical protein